MKALRHILAACLAAALLCTVAFASSGFNAGLSIDRETEGQISVTVQDSSVLAEKRPTLTIPCDYAYAKVTCPDGSVAYCTGTGSEVSFTAFMGGTYLIKSISQLPSGGGGNNAGGNPGSTSTDITTGTDGSTTVTTVNEQTGEVTKTTTTTEGVTGTTVTDKSGAVTEASASIPYSAAKNAADNGETVTVPVTVPAVTESSQAPAVKITVPAGAGKVSVEIPVEKTSAGLVAVIVAADGTETIVRTSTVTENGVELDVEGNTTVKIIDNSVDFGDVPANIWYGDAVDFVSARGLFGGVSSTGAVFDVSGMMTRGTLAVVIHRLENEPEQDFEGMFGDVADGIWYSEAISWAAQEGVITGYGDQFWPEENITREQLAVMLWRYAGSPESSHSLAHCPDADQISGYAEQAMAWANERGIIKGDGDNVLSPKGYATRTEVAQMLKNYIENVIRS